MAGHDVDVAWFVLGAASQLVEGVSRGMAERGYSDVRPAHGFAFVRIAAGDASTLDVAAHLGVTKQAASQLVEQLVVAGYVVRRNDPADGRRRILALTAKGRRCTAAAEDATADVVAEWRTRVGGAGLRTLRVTLAELELSGPLRPAW